MCLSLHGDYTVVNLSNAVYTTAKYSKATFIRLDFHDGQCIFIYKKSSAPLDYYLTHSTMGQMYK